MKRAFAFCGMLEDEGDILVCCQGPNCSLRLPGVFHGRCAAALGHSGGARWQNCPWCPPTTLREKPATVTGVDGSDEGTYFTSTTRFPQEMEMDPQEDCDSRRMGGATAREVTGGRATLCGAFAGGRQRLEKDGESQGDAIHLEGRRERIEKAPEQGAGELGT